MLEEDFAGAGLCIHRPFRTFRYIHHAARPTDVGEGDDVRPLKGSVFHAVSDDSKRTKKK